MKVQVLLQTAALIILSWSSKVRNPVNDQHCAIITEEYEHLMQERKRSAFRNCFTKQTCSYELALFEDCFGQSIRTVRASFNSEILNPNNFIDSADRYLSALENCFDPTQVSIQFPDFKSTLIDEDAIYARTICSLEYADHLWGLPQLISTYSYLENSAAMACLAKLKKTGRVFGNGINRFIDSADLKLNNTNDSCLLEENEMQCYHQYINNDKFYQRLLIDRDRIMRSCIRRVRLRTRCHSSMLLGFGLAFVVPVRSSKIVSKFLYCNVFDKVMQNNYIASAKIFRDNGTNNKMDISISLS